MLALLIASQAGRILFDGTAGNLVPATREFFPLPVGEADLTLFRPRTDDGFGPAADEIGMTAVGDFFRLGLRALRIVLCERGCSRQ